MSATSLTQRQRALVTIGVMLALLLAALDTTIVGTALPHIVAELQGLGVTAIRMTLYWQGVAPSPSSKDFDSMLIMSSIKGPANSSTMVDRADPLWPPKVSIAPRRASAGSTVGRPSGSSASPGAMLLPARL